MWRSRNGETVCTVAFHDESCPYLIPLNYGAEVEEGKLVLYFHGAKEGTKIDKIRENPQVSYCIYGKNSLKIDYDAACKSTTSFGEHLRKRNCIFRRRSHIEEKKLWRAS